MGITKKNAELVLKTVVGLALIAGISCAKPAGQSLAKNVDRFLGVYVLEDSAQELTRSLSPRTAFADAGQALLLEVGVNYWANDNGGGMIEGLQTTEAPNVYLIVPAKDLKEPSYMHAYPSSEDKVEIVQEKQENIVQLKWRGRIYRSLGKTLSAREALAGWTNERVLAGEYKGPGGRKYLFSGSGDAQWPDRTFAYSMELDRTHSRAPNCDFIRVKDKPEYIGFRRAGGKLLLFHTEPVTIENGRLPLVQPGGEMPFECSSKPFLVLTPAKKM